MTIPPQPLSLSGKLGRWFITIGLVIFLWISGLCHLAQLSIKHHDSSLLQDLGVTWFGTGLLTILILFGYFTISFSCWARRMRRWNRHCDRVAKLEKQNRVMRRMLSSRNIRFS